MRKLTHLVLLAFALTISIAVFAEPVKSDPTTSTGRSDKGANPDGVIEPAPTMGGWWWW